MNGYEKKLKPIHYFLFGVMFVFAVITLTMSIINL